MINVRKMVGWTPVHCQCLLHVQASLQVFNTFKLRSIRLLSIEHLESQNISVYSIPVVVS